MNNRPPRTRARAAVLIAIAVLGLSAASLIGYRTLTRAATRPEAPPPDIHRAAIDRGRMYLRRNRPDLALEAVSGVRDEASGAGEAMTVAGLALVRMNQFAGARLALERAVKLQPDSLEATRALASLSLMLGNGVRGAQLLEAATRLDPKDTRSWLALAKVSHDLGEPARAAQAFEEVLRLDPTNREALVGLITDLLNSNRTDDASPRIAQALAAHPNDPTLLGLAARQARDAGRGDEAARLATRAIELDPDNLSARLVRARTELAAGRPETALPDLERATAAHPSDMASLQLLAQVEARLGLDARARASGERHKKASERAVRMDGLTQAIARNPDDPAPHCEMGRLAAEAGSTFLAMQCYQAALALDPKYQPALDGLEAVKPAAPASTPPQAPR